jgi:MFS family permease
MPHAATRAVVRQGATWSALLRPLADRRFRQLLLFGGWLALFSGFVQSAQQLYVMHALGISLAVSLAARTGMQAGQWATSPRAGRMVDRWGHRPVLAASLLLASAGPMCYFIATPETWWWFFGAWVMWIAYVGLNVALPSLMLRLSPADADTPYIAVYYTLTGLCYAASTIAGGAWLDAARDETYALAGIEITAFQAMFLVAWLGRSAGVVWLIGLREKPRRGSVA